MSNLPTSAAAQATKPIANDSLPILSATQALRFGAPCRVQIAPGFYFIHDEERTDRLYSEGLLPSPTSRR